MSESTLVVYEDPNMLARGERDGLRRCRQVVDIILVSPNGQELCLCEHQGAVIDKKLNLSPPQGGLEYDEYLEGAAIRELREEIGVISLHQPVYLGSLRRSLPDEHPRKDKYDQYHHHWFVVFATTGKLHPRAPITKAGWWRFDNVSSSAQHVLSVDKSAMFLLALRQLFKLNRDTVLVRPENILPRPAAVFLGERSAA